MFVKALLALTALFSLPFHPHNPKALKLHGAKGMVTVTYFTVPYNPDQLASLEPGFDWHLGFATLETQVDLTCGEQKVATGKYKLNVRRGDDKDAWSVVLVPHELTRAESGVRSARRNGEDAVTEAQAALETVRADLKAKGTASETVLTIAKFEAGNAEHLGVIGIHHGYDTVQRGSEEPASGMHCSLRVSFGDLHRELDLHEVFTPPAKR